MEALYFFHAKTQRARRLFCHKIQLEAKSLCATLRLRVRQIRVINSSTQSDGAYWAKKKERLRTSPFKSNRVMLHSALQKTKPIFVKIISNLRKTISNVI